MTADHGVQDGLRLLRHSHDDPALNLALDEALLNGVESGALPDTLRFWESPRPFVVVGMAQRLASEAREVACAEDGVPILRRCSAGGCVLQGPGSLNFTLAMSYERWPALRNLHHSYTTILKRIASALREHGVAAHHDGVSDLVVEGRKVSGNAQRRRSKALIHHGTVLHRVDHDAMERYLKEPIDRPNYRGRRTHREFCGCVPLAPEQIERAIATAFGASPTPLDPGAWECAHAEELAENKYRDRTWTHRR